MSAILAIAWMVYCGTALAVVSLEVASRSWLKALGMNHLGPVVIKDPMNAMRDSNTLFRGIIRFTCPIILNLGLGILLGKYLFLETWGEKSHDAGAMNQLAHFSYLTVDVLAVLLAVGIVNVSILLFSEVNRLRSVGLQVMPGWLWRGIWWPMLLAFDKANKQQKKMMLCGFALPILSCCWLISVALMLLFLKAERPWIIRLFIR
jgi:hypothetical protein